MKGQEIEEIVGYLIQSGLKDYFGIDEPVVEVPQNKKTADIKFQFKGEERSFDIKSYGGADRFQIATIKGALQDIRDRFLGTQARVLDGADKDWVIQRINEIEIGYTLFFLSFLRPGNSIEIDIFDFETLSVDRFKELDFTLKIVGKEKRVEIFINITENSNLEISAGGNPLNRGLWINRIRSPNDMKLVYQTGYFYVILQKIVQLDNFDKGKYIFEKAAKTIEIVKKYFTTLFFS